MSHLESAASRSSGEMGDPNCAVAMKCHITLLIIITTDFRSDFWPHKVH